MLKQTSIDFDAHLYEPLAETQEILDNNRHKFRDDLKRIYLFLMSGGRGTVHDMRIDRSRLSELKKSGVKMSFVLDSGKFRVWFCSQEDKEYNKENFGL